MPETNMVRVTVAPDREVTVPHPSGMIEEPYTVFAGQTVRVSQEKAVELWNRTLILHPVSGQLHPGTHRRLEEPRVTITTMGQVFDASDPNVHMRIAEQERKLLEASPPHAPEPITAGRWDPGFSGMVRQWDRQEADPITGADGKPWPSF